MSNWEETLNQLIDLSGTLEHQIWLHKQLNKLKQEINEELQNRPSS